ncbi:hypothetical protein JW933_09815 [candidate division FCPU426 bacterium]|nr:hypothetical protein [candidate division FCPU426 bacterium]
MNVSGIKRKMQYSLLHLLGVSPIMQQLEKRLLRLEEDMQFAHERLAEYDAEIALLDCCYYPLDKLEQELSRLEKIFAQNQDNRNSLRWFGTLSGPSEYMKITDKIFANGM